VTHITRRSWIGMGARTGVAAGLLIAPGGRSLAQTQDGTAAGAPPVADLFPTQPPELVKEMVGVSHGNVARVKELVEARPALARASWDWGFGDWEAAIDAASHVGHREIAEYLIAKGARPTVFTAAMLGQLEVVKALVAAQPGIQRLRGPHGITLLAHARAGGAGAAAVATFLESLGDADPRPTLVPLGEAEMTAIAGTYAFGPAERDRIEIAIDRGQPGFLRIGGTRRTLFHVGSFAFFPVGVEAVRVRFEIEGGRATALTIHDPDLVLRARRLA
jgi:hypothetical protein